MNSNPITTFLALVIVVIFVLIAFIPTETITESYFDSHLIVEVAHNGSAFASDQVSFVFEEAGTYTVTILPISKTDSIVNSFAITIGADETPQIKTVKKWSINNMTIIISKDGVSESHDFIYPH